jgi:hypothetical protein
MIVKEISSGNEAREKLIKGVNAIANAVGCLLYTSPSPGDES